MAERRATSPTLAEPDAARYLGFTAAALRAWRRESRGPAFIRTNRSVRYRLEDLDRFQAANRVQTRDSRAYDRAAAGARR